MLEDESGAAEGASEEKEPKRAKPLRAELNDSFIARLRREKPPVGYDNEGKLKFEADPLSKSYILWDSSRDSPPGFGVKVAGNKTYVLRRKVHGKSIMVKVGNFGDMDVAKARERAGRLALQILDTGRNPNEIARQRAANELTLSQAMEDYRRHLVERSRPASRETLRVFDRAAGMVTKWGWQTRKIVDLLPEEIDSKFSLRKDEVPSANEQNFRWASRAVAWCVEREKLTAQVQRRQPALAANPFDTLANHGRFRDALTLEAQRKAKGVRNPLTRTETLGKFLEAAWSKKESLSEARSATTPSSAGKREMTILLCSPSLPRQTNSRPMPDTPVVHCSSRVATGRALATEGFFNSPTRSERTSFSCLLPGEMNLIFTSHCFPARSKMSRSIEQSLPASSGMATPAAAGSSLLPFLGYVKKL